MMPRRAARSCSTARVTRWCDGRTGRSWKHSISSCEARTRQRCEPRSALRAGSSRGCCQTWRSASVELPLPVAADPDTERHRLHTAVADLLAGVGRRTPLVVVIEDGHWADTPTLLLLRHLARGAPDARALLVTTFRDTEAEVPKALSAALVDLRRSEGVVRLRLGGLSAEEISEFVARAAGGDFGRGPSRDRSSLERADRRQRVPDNRAVAHASGERDRLGLRRRDAVGARRCGARKPGGRARGRQPAPGAAEHAHHEAAGAGRRRRTGIRALRHRAVRVGRRGAARRASNRRSRTE